MQIHDVLTAPRSPRQNAYIERFSGSIRRECHDHVIVLSVAGFQRVLADYLAYYMNTRTHLSASGCTTAQRHPVINAIELALSMPDRLLGRDKPLGTQACRTPDDLKDQLAASACSSRRRTSSGSECDIAPGKLVARQLPEHSSACDRFAWRRCGGRGRKDPRSCELMPFPVKR
jgi:Integrase core domain